MHTFIARRCGLICFVYTSFVQKKLITVLIHLTYYYHVRLMLNMYPFYVLIFLHQTIAIVSVPIRFFICSVLYNCLLTNFEINTFISYNQFPYHLSVLVEHALVLKILLYLLKLLFIIPLLIIFPYRRVIISRP